MITAVLLLVCLVLAGAVTALAVAVRRLGSRVQELASAPLVDEERGLVTGAGAPSSTTVGAGASTSTTVGAGAPTSTTGGPTSDYVITRLGQEPAEPAPTMDGRLFADIVLRESVVKAASWAYAVRRGLSPANRNRIRFEMRLEVKRARKERKAEEREAIRQYRAQKRAAVRVQTQEESAA